MEKIVLVVILSMSVLFITFQDNSFDNIHNTIGNLDATVEEIVNNNNDGSSKEAGESPDKGNVFDEKFDQLYQKMNSKNALLYQNSDKTQDLIKVDEIKNIVETNTNYSVEEIKGYSVCYGDLYYLFESKGQAYRINARSIQVFRDLKGLSDEFIPVEDMREITVANYYEFIQSVSSYRIIYLLPGNYDLVQFTNEYSYNEAVSKYTNSISISGVKDMSIIGKCDDDSKVDFISNNPDASVIAFYGCNNIAIEKLRFSHAEIFEDCMGITGWISGCENFTIVDCDIYGSGRVGISVSDSKYINIIDSYIYDCSDYEVYITNCDGVTFLRCIIEDESACKVFSDNSQNIVFENSFIFAFEGIPVIESINEDFYYYPINDVESIVGYEDSVANVNGLTGYLGDIKYIDTWIGKKFVYEKVKPIADHLEENVQEYVSLRVRDDYYKNIVSLKFKINEEINYTKLAEFVDKIARIYMIEPYNNESDIQFVINDNYKVNFSGEGSIREWLEDDIDNLQTFATIAITDKSGVIDDFMVDSGYLTYAEALDQIYRFTGFENKKFTDCDEYYGLARNLELYNIEIYNQQVRYNFSLRQGEPFIGDLYYDWTFANLSVDAINGDVYDREIEGYINPIIQPTQDLKDFLSLHELVYDDLEYVPDYSSLYVLYDDPQHTILKVVMYSFKNAWEETLYWGQPIIVKIKKDSLGRYDPDKESQEEIIQYYKLFENYYVKDKQYKPLTFCNQGINKGFYYTYSLDNIIDKVIGLLVDNIYVDMYIENDEVFFTYGKYSIENETLITTPYYQGTIEFKESIADDISNIFNKENGSSKEIKPSILLNDTDYTYGIILDDNCYGYFGKEIPSVKVFYKAYNYINKMNLELDIE